MATKNQKNRTKGLAAHRVSKKPILVIQLITWEVSFQSRVRTIQCHLAAYVEGFFLVTDSTWQLDSANCPFLTHNDTFMLPHLTKQARGSRTDTSLSARCSLFSEIAAHTVIKPGSHFLSLCRSNRCSALWVRMKDPTGTSSNASPCPPLQGAGSQLSHFLFHETTYTTGG